MMKNYSTAAVALALGISENAIISEDNKKGLNIAQILMLSENAKLKRYDEEAAVIRKLVSDIKALEK
jgi:hypothetical protein